MCFRDTGFTLRNPKQQSDDNEIQTYRILQHGLTRLQKVRTAIYYCQDVMFIKARLCSFVEISKYNNCKSTSKFHTAKQPSIKNQCNPIYLSLVLWFSLSLLCAWTSSALALAPGDRGHISWCSFLRLLAGDKL